jgi:uncharacterized protein YkwD
MGRCRSDRSWVPDEQKVTSTTGGTRRRRPVHLLAGIVVVLVAGASCESTPVDRSEVIASVNQSRSEQGLKPLRENVELDQKADAWAQHLRDVCDLSHSTLSDGAPSTWLKLGENVGYGGTIAVIHEAYLNSPGHRANIMDPTFTQVGAAAVWGDCQGQHRVFTVQEFMHG